jgi:hypothetical protein
MDFLITLLADGPTTGESLGGVAIILSIAQIVRQMWREYLDNRESIAVLEAASKKELAKIEVDKALAAEAAVLKAKVEANEAAVQSCKSEHQAAVKELAEDTTLTRVIQSSGTGIGFCARFCANRNACHQPESITGYGHSPRS